jgi:hypothetical protein
MRFSTAYQFGASYHQESMATGYESFLKDSKNVITSDHILELSPSNDDNEFILQAGADRSTDQTTGFLQVLAFTDYVRDGCQDFVKGDFVQGLVKRGSCCIAEEEVTSNGTNAQMVQMTSKAHQEGKKSLVTGGKWVSGKVKTAACFVIGKLLKEDPAVTMKEELNAVTPENFISAFREARKNNVTDQVKKVIKEEKGNGSDDDTVDTEEDSS